MSKMMKVPALLAVVAAVFVVSAAPAIAFTEFIQKPAESGNQDKGGKQVFKTKAGTVECEEEKSNGGSTVEKSNQAWAQVKYQKCKAFGIPTVIAPFEYNFHANGTVTVENTVLIKAASGETKCELEVSPELNGEAKNKELAGITYINNKPGISIVAAQKGIISYKVLESGGLCPATLGVAKNGSYEGEAKTETYPGSLCQYVGQGLGEWEDAFCTVKGTKNSYKKLPSYTNLEIV